MIFTLVTPCALFFFFFLQKETLHLTSKPKVAKLINKQIYESNWKICSTLDKVKAKKEQDNH